ncbi:MAG: LamG-like jellyroll fold domain-containing protein [Candidatus Falkowbacteria bacterium]
MIYKKRSGFTLIELLVVIAIIGILATIAVVALQNARAKARDARRIADVKQVQTALELFFNDQQRYPTTAEFNAGSIFSTTTNGTTTYMAKIPVAPTPNDNTCATADNNYTYTSNDGATYSLSFCLGGPTGTTRAGVNAASPIGISYIGSGNSILLAAGGCSCTNAALPCCQGCDGTFAQNACIGGTYCSRNANCASGTYCIGGTCVAAATGGAATISGLVFYLNAASQVATTTGNYVTGWNDLSGNGYNAIQDAGGYQPVYMSSVAGRPAVSFGGSTYLYTNNTSAFNYSNMTISTWIYADVVNTGGYPVLVNKGYYEMGSGWEIILAGTANIGKPYIVSNQSVLTSGITIPLSTWHNIVVVLNGASTNAKIYIDGVLTDNSNSITSPILNNLNLEIGRRRPGATAAQTFSGKIGELEIYNRSLSDSEVNNLYNVTK